MSASSQSNASPGVGSVRPGEVLECGDGAFAAAAGWLARRAERILQDTSYMDRVVHAVTTDKKIDVSFLHKLDIDIRYACRARNRVYPELRDFFNPLTRLLVGREQSDGPPDLTEAKTQNAPL